MILDSRRYALAALLLMIGVVHAEPRREQSLAEMDHKTWTARDGAPQGINALAQAADGTLWIGSDSGLFTFDGREFSPYQSPTGEPELPVEQVRTLCVARDGTLWVGFFQAGVARIGQGHVTIYPKLGDNRLSVMYNLREARDGSIWGVSAQRRLVRFGVDQQWHEEDPPQKDGDKFFAFLDSSDTLWVAQAGRLYRRDIRESTYTETTTPADWMFGFAELPDGTLWLTDFDGETTDVRLQHVDRLGNLLASVPGIDTNASDIVYRPDGSLVYAAPGDGLLLFSREALAGPKQVDKDFSPEAFTQRDGLTSARVLALLRDADGTLWTGSDAGLDRFSTGSFVPSVTDRESESRSVCTNERGEVWIAVSAGKLYRIAGGKTTVFEKPDSLSNLFCGRDGDVWLVARTGAWNVHGDEMTAVPPIPGVSSFGMSNVAATSDHTLFATVGGNEAAGGGLWQYKQGEWARFSGPGVLSTTGLVIYVDRQDRLWVGYRDQVTRPTLTGGEVLSAPGLGLVYVLGETQRGFFAAGVNGLAVLRGSRFDMLAFEDRISIAGVNGLVEARNGDLWINTSRGIVRVPANELQAALATPSYRMKSELVTEGDFAGVTVTFDSQATAARDSDGNLWFVTRTGVFHLDPEHHSSDIRPPIVSIRSIAADRVPLGPESTFEPRPQTVEISYFGVHLTDPDRVTYKYRLAGLEDAWQDAGRRTEAFYTRLGPGTYTFQVMASSGNDVWTPPVASPPFVVLPSFYQTIWFRVLCVVAGIALAFGLFTLRVRVVARAIRTRAEERADERIRIARELHDTLLQGIQGLLLNFHVAAQKIAPDDSSRAMLERALATADRIILEGRNRVSSLRSEHLTDGELVASLENAARDLRPDGKAHFDVKRSGTTATLHSAVADEVFCIAREALTNALRHSEAEHIGIELSYGNRYFSMVCVDDGCGFDASKAEKNRHWGLRGMAERARKLGGRLHVRSDAARGTEIIASVPSYRAYQHHSRLMFYLRALRFSEGDAARARISRFETEQPSQQIRSVTSRE